ncbi:hypothetical protein C453_00375 [Haloferax elongans ATCC BAA-1513]|uniref:DUF368 domain-containing protein n=2 Tax=Haloferax elongans TaxID=403191 RepID=M0HY00_HALEO|nr:DUF368 domain-containing protein [Haloferax elongans]ELZ89485.1 hypothetical protein C453_00375 [Haloferax elongans ATCC BAA-1513]
MTLPETLPPPQESMQTFLIGLLMGTADGVPGVSGGTIALITGIYERLLAAITAVTPSRVGNCLRAVSPLHGGISPAQITRVLDEVDGWFLLTLLGGISTAIILVGQAVEWANEHTPVLLFGLFFGFIGASAVILLRAAAIRTLPEATAAVLGVTAAFVISGQSQALLETGSLPVLFVAGAIAISAMILPGLSGSLLLVILGQYTYMYGKLGEFLDGIVTAATTGSLDTLVTASDEVTIFILGGLVGLFTVARVIRRALDAYQDITYAFLISLVLGALRAPITTLNSAEYSVTWNTATIQAFAMTALSGALIVFVLDWYAVDIDLETV